MGPDNAVHAGPWRLLNWPRQTPLAGWAQDIRVQLATHESTSIELVDGPWSCAKHEFRENGLWLDLTLVHVESGRSVSGTFDMEDGVWAQSDGSGHMTVAEFHRAYASNATTIAIWPPEPFKDVHAPSELSARSPDGEFYIDLTTNQWRMSDWICPPRIVHIPTGDCLLDLKTTNWDGRAEFRPDGTAELRLRQYPGVQFSLTVELDLNYERYRVTKGEHDKLPTVGYIDELQRAIGRSAQDLDELGVTIDVRASRRDEVKPDKINGASDDEAWAERRDRLGLNSDDDFEPVELAPLIPTPMVQPIVTPAPTKPTLVAPAPVAPTSTLITPAAATPAPPAPKAAAPVAPMPVAPKPIESAPVAPMPAAPAPQASFAPPAATTFAPAMPAPIPLASKPPASLPTPVTLPAPAASALQSPPSAIVQPISRPTPAPTPTPIDTQDRPSTFSTPRGAEAIQRLVPPATTPVQVAKTEPLAPQPIPPAPRSEPAIPVTPTMPTERAPTEVISPLDAAAALLGLNGDDIPAPPPPISVRGAIEAIEAEVTRQRLNAALHYEMIVLGVIRAAASGITKPADAVSILQTLAARREDIGPKSWQAARP